MHAGIEDKASYLKIVTERLEGIAFVAEYWANKNRRSGAGLSLYHWSASITRF